MSDDTTKAVNDCFEDARKACKELSILVIGETGVGKSTLVNNLLGINDALEGDTVESETYIVEPFKSIVNGVPVCIYDTPGLGDSREERDDYYLGQIQPLIQKVHLIICCIKMNASRMHEGIIHMLKKYNRIGVDWEKTVFALSFADAVKPPSSIRKAAGFKMETYFNGRLLEWRKDITAFLARETRVRRETLPKLKINPTTDDCEAVLPNGEYWFTPFWLDVLRVLPPGPLVRFLDIFSESSNLGSHQVAEKEQACVQLRKDRSTSELHVPDLFEIEQPPSTASITSAESDSFQTTLFGKPGFDLFEKGFASPPVQSSKLKLDVENQREVISIVAASFKELMKTISSMKSVVFAKLFGHPGSK